MKLCIAAFVLVATAAQGTTAYQGEDAKGAERTVTGCLSTDAENAGQFYVLEDGSGKRVRLSGKEDLVKHKHHKVKVTGRLDASVKDTMSVSKVEHLADVCTGPK